MARCPICETELSRDTPTFPFCSDRCRLIDLGNWLGGRYVIPGRDDDDDAGKRDAKMTNDDPARVSRPRSGRRGGVAAEQGWGPRPKAIENRER